MTKHTDIAALAARVLALSEQTEHEPWAYDMLSGHVISRIWTADVEFVADLDTEGSENVTGEFIAYTRTAAPILAAECLRLQKLMAQVEYLAQANPTMGVKLSLMVAKSRVVEQETPDAPR